jgi:hypothetical protein
VLRHEFMGPEVNHYRSGRNNYSYLSLSIYLDISQTKGNASKIKTRLGFSLS